MSFNEKCKDELMKKNPTSGEAVAMLSAIIKSSGSIVVDKNGRSLVIETDSLEGIKTAWSILDRIYHISCEIDINKPNTIMKNHSYSLSVLPKNMGKILSDCGLGQFENETLTKLTLGLGALGKEEQFLAAYARALFLDCGNAYVPEEQEKHTGYHLELNFNDEVFALEFVAKMEEYDITFKTIERGEGITIYLKDSSKISDFLAMIGADNCVLGLNCLIVDRYTKNNVNRQTNCEMANISKAVEAGQKQLAAIRLIEEKIGLNSLSDKLKQIALIRRDNPEYTFEQIAEELGEEISKSGINHRFRKLIEIASELEKGGRK